MNQLTPEQLDMIKRLQLLFKDKMGEWQEEDEGFCMEHRRVYIDNCPFAADKYSECDGEQLRIPKPIDWQNPERGCWGMADKNRWTIISHNSNDWIIQDNSNKRTKLCDSIIADPFTALLMALVAQEGV